MEAEPAYTVELEGADEGVRAVACELASKYEQESVAWFAEDPGGGEVLFRLDGVADTSAFCERLIEAGVPGAWLTEQGLQVTGPTEWAEKLEQVRTELAVAEPLRATVGRLIWLQRGKDYE